MERNTFPGTPESLEHLRSIVKEAAHQAGLPKKATYNLMLAVDEIASNIIMHGYEEAGIEGPIDILTEQTDHQLIITLEDDAAPFDPLAREKPGEDFFIMPLEDRPIGGMGIHLTVNGVDEFRYELANDRNRNIFIMKTTNDA